MFSGLFVRFCEQFDDCFGGAAGGTLEAPQFVLETDMMNRDDAIRARRVILMDTSAYSTARDLLMPCVWCALFY